jgi:hypothetical protein
MSGRSVAGAPFLRRQPADRFACTLEDQTSRYEEESRAMLPEPQNEAFNRFYKTARFNDVLDAKTTVLIHLATAMSVACYP